MLVSLAACSQAVALTNDHTGARRDERERVHRAGAGVRYLVSWPVPLIVTPYVRIICLSHSRPASPSDIHTMACRAAICSDLPWLALWLTSPPLLAVYRCQAGAWRFGKQGLAVTR